MVVKKSNNLDQYGKIPPQNIEIEEAVLGALMLDCDAWLSVNGLIDTESFYKEDNRTVFESIKYLHQNNKPIDLLTVTKRLKEINKLDSVGGAVFITSLTSKVATASHIVHHAAIIQQLFIQRELIRISGETIEDGYDSSQDIDLILSNVKNKISLLEDSTNGINTGLSQSDVVTTAIMEIERDCNEVRMGQLPGINTGLKCLNDATGGWRNGNFIIIASRPGVGKTSMALKFALEAALKGKWVNFYGFEMTAPDLMRIMISGQSDVSRSKIRDGYVSNSDWDLINSAMINFDNLPIIWNDNVDTNAIQISAMTRRNKKRGKCDLVIVDYLQIVPPRDLKVNREQQISEISRTFKKTTVRENIPIIALCQLNRDAENVKPQLNHLRESGSLEQDADLVIFPYIEDNQYSLVIAKNRRGKKGTFGIFANEEMTKFGDLESPINDTF